ncbi:MAG: hypothetical protein ACM3Q4_16270 [Acidobacteriota bacterium]
MKQLLIFTAAVSLLAGCSSLRLEPADFSWPVESVLKADANGMVAENRYGTSFSINELMKKEFDLKDDESATAAGADKTVRVIRDKEGYYYITAPKFKNVYVFRSGEGEMKLCRKIEIGETPMNDPKFNQRDSYIELLNDSTTLRLDKDGIMEEGDKK